MDSSNSSLIVSGSEAYEAFALDKSLWLNLSLIVMIVLGSVGNGLCCYAVAKYKFLRTVPNFYITALCVSDLIMCVFVLPPMVFNGFHEDGWVLGKLICRLWIFLFSVGAMSSILVLCMVSVDRYLSIATPVKYLKYRKPRIALAVIIGGWLAVVGISVVFTRQAYHANGCYLGSPTEPYRRLSLCMFWIPTTILVIVNVGTARAIWKINRPRRIGPARNPNVPRPAPVHNQRDVQADVLEMQQIRSDMPSCSSRRSTTMRHPTGVKADDATMANIPGPSFSKEPQRVASSAAVTPVTAPVDRRQQQDTDLRPNQQLRIEDIIAARRKKSFAMIAVVVGSYIVRWLPFFSIILYSKQHPEVYQTPVAPWPLVASLWLAFLNSTINPIIYASMKRDYKRAMKMILRCRRA
ncbi:muscarinic acetylcholine receptor M5-like [Patiria miniata]|uniref:G-protein coupled receptors family 1 profile domain-containing protein n=1 Tax=Patiria miniata TaxID=46514 RepID=A0A914B4H1_PATMI|nr:muscarinic acetylcholine receptor M5-like [Patiria miniata]